MFPLSVYLFPLLEDFFGDTIDSVSPDKVEANLSNMETDIQISPTPTLRIHKVHPKKPKKIFDALKDPSWVEAMEEELLQFKIQNVWVLVDCPNREEGIDYEEVFAPVARIEAIRLFLAYASYMGFIVYQMDVKSAFLYGTIDDKVVKAMYGLHQAPRAWYGTLSKYLLDNGFQRDTIDQTLFIRNHKGEFLLVQVYVDNIIFRSSNPKLCREFEALMHDKFKMSVMGELKFFLGLQVLQKKYGIFLSQDKYVVDILKKFGYTDIRSMIGSLMYLTASRPDIMFAVCACARHQVRPKECHLHTVKRIFRYLKGHPKLGLWYPKESPFDLVAYSDSDYGGANQDRKCTIRGCQFLGRRLISWQCKKQTIVATSTTKAEYVAAASGCGQVLWIQNQLLDYGYNFMNTKIYIDNNSAICIVKNLVYHFKTKHIEIRHHFIRDCYEKKLINVDHIHIDDNVADLLTKAFDVGRFQYLVVSIGMLDP
ncbi:putative ribonuclease H-like domain-containing protein [Tanacetum coccineum]|uniref:Ribonuclease H-like domain-containing protein n=1 Tax=Tanacetum coccineum TaxID=301880 RepID=A0ABQ5DM69_9ASTR